MNVRKYTGIAANALAIGVCVAVASGCSDTSTATPADMRVVTPADLTVVPTPDLTGVAVDMTEVPQTIRLSEDISTNTTLKAINKYIIPRTKYLFVTNGATLTLEPGTTICGEQGSVMVVARGSKIIADGTKDKPIVFTSCQEVGKRTGGWWGGLLVLGAAPINVNSNSMPASAEATYEAFTSAIPEGKFGGNNPNDDSGILRYVRVEFAGFNFVADREFNNITLCGVGDKTVIDFVQAHGGSDDGIEFFGGTVNVKHVVSSQNGDDGFDTDNGWQGKAQFVIVQNANPQGSVEASNGYESDNHATQFTATPRTLPTGYNFTTIGKKDYVGGTSWAAVLRRGTGGKYYNHIIANFPKGIEVRDLATRDQLDAGNLFIKNSIFFNTDGQGASVNWPAPQMANDVDEKAYFLRQDWSNREVDPGLTEAAFDLRAPSFKPTNGAAALTGGATPPNDGFFDATATFVGAVGADDWTQGWTAFPAN